MSIAISAHVVNDDMAYVEVTTGSVVVQVCGSPQELYNAFLQAANTVTDAFHRWAERSSGQAVFDFPCVAAAWGEIA